MYDAYVGFSVNAEDWKELSYRDWEAFAASPISKSSVGRRQVSVAGSAYNICQIMLQAGLAVRLQAALGDMGIDQDFYRPYLERGFEELHVDRLEVRSGSSSYADIWQPKNGDARIVFQKNPVTRSRAKVGLIASKIAVWLRHYKPRVVIATGVMPDELPLAIKYLEYEPALRVFSPHHELIIKELLTADLLTQVDYLFLSNEEISNVSLTLDQDSLCEFAGEHHLNLLVITDGPKGVWAATEDECWNIVPPRIGQPIKNATGAGDILLGALISAQLKMLKGKEFPNPKEALRFGVAAARLHCTRIGGSDVPAWEDIESLVRDYGWE